MHRTPIVIGPWMTAARRAGVPVESPRVLSVLIVDDNQDAADTLAALAGIWGYPVRVAYDGESAYRAACEDPPDCLILDIALPGLDGYELAGRVRQTPALRRAKLVAHTAFSDAQHARRATEAGFDYQLTKPAAPADLERLLAMLDNIARLAEKTEELARQNVALAGQTKELLETVKSDIQEVKEDVKELKQELREVADRVNQANPPGSPPSPPAP